MNKNYKKIILYEDEDITVLNKPSGLLSIPDGYDPDLPSLKNLLQKSYGQIWVVHRLDKLTSGVIIFAKNESAHRILNLQFSQHSVKKNYRSISHGFPVWNEKTVRIPLKVNGDRHHRTIRDEEKGKEAITRFKVLDKTDRHCLFDIFPNSGITHQIRVHASLLGFPVVGDPLYYHPFSINERKHLKIKQNLMFLHSYQIRITHPVNKNPLVFTAPLPDYFTFDNIDSY